MCDTCGCGQPDETVTLRKPGQESHSHLHDHGHHHDHDHSHSHDHGEHSHDHGRTVEVETNVLEKNNLIAERNRGYFEAKNIFTLKIQCNNNL